ncbi:hypothetical protein A1OE_1313 [Candidatus Endolissoclinum faulkneri L2]|uniref:Uncharacterized protein n=1 Tax=Candidatus Endolissoclinum faulkneri L2 TaxID=1193729 RepID=K7ZDG0_9PROT|nr:hypothetical protein A1OE_1313 [Candidatus Endolissoclinum faulkneri L2]
MSALYKLPARKILNNLLSCIASLYSLLAHACCWLARM